eukprot:scpid35270/ scgid25170/ 
MDTSAVTTENQIGISGAVNTMTSSSQSQPLAGQHLIQNADAQGEFPSSSGAPAPAAVALSASSSAVALGSQPVGPEHQQSNPSNVGTLPSVATVPTLPENSSAAAAQMQAGPYMDYHTFRSTMNYTQLLPAAPQYGWMQYWPHSTTAPAAPVVQFPGQQFPGQPPPPGSSLVYINATPPAASPAAPPATSEESAAAAPPPPAAAPAGGAAAAAAVGAAGQTQQPVQPAAAAQLSASTNAGATTTTSSTAVRHLNPQPPGDAAALHAQAMLAEAAAAALPVVSMVPPTVPPLVAGVPQIGPSTQGARHVPQFNPGQVRNLTPTCYVSANSSTESSLLNLPFGNDQQMQGSRGAPLHWDTSRAAAVPGFTRPPSPSQQAAAQLLVRMQDKPAAQQLQPSIRVNPDQAAAMAAAKKVIRAQSVIAANTASQASNDARPPQLSLLPTPSDDQPPSYHQLVPTSSAGCHVNPLQHAAMMTPRTPSAHQGFGEIITSPAGGSSVLLQQPTLLQGGFDAALAHQQQIQQHQQQQQQQQFQYHQAPHSGAAGMQMEILPSHMYQQAAASQQLYPQYVHPQLPPRPPIVLRSPDRAPVRFAAAPAPAPAASSKPGGVQVPWPAQSAALDANAASHAGGFSEQHMLSSSSASIGPPCVGGHIRRPGALKMPAAGMTNEMLEAKRVLARKHSTMAKSSEKLLQREFRPAASNATPAAVVANAAYQESLTAMQSQTPEGDVMTMSSQAKGGDDEQRACTALTAKMQQTIAAITRQETAIGDASQDVWKEPGEGAKQRRQRRKQEPTSSSGPRDETSFVSSPSAAVLAAVSSISKSSKHGDKVQSKRHRKSSRPVTPPPISCALHKREPPFSHPFGRSTTNNKYRCVECTQVLETYVRMHGSTPDSSQKRQLLPLVGMTISQITYWFSNKRRRTKPKETTADPSHCADKSGARTEVKSATDVPALNAAASIPPGSRAAKSRLDSPGARRRPSDATPAPAETGAVDERVDSDDYDDAEVDVCGRSSSTPATDSQRSSEDDRAATMSLSSVRTAGQLSSAQSKSDCADCPQPRSAATAAVSRSGKQRARRTPRRLRLRLGSSASSASSPVSQCSSDDLSDNTPYTQHSSEEDSCSASQEGTYKAGRGKKRKKKTEDTSTAAVGIASTPILVSELFTIGCHAEHSLDSIQPPPAQHPSTEHGPVPMATQVVENENSDADSPTGAPTIHDAVEPTQAADPDAHDDEAEVDLPDNDNSPSPPSKSSGAVCDESLHGSPSSMGREKKENVAPNNSDGDMQCEDSQPEQQAIGKGQEPSEDVPASGSSGVGCDDSLQGSDSSMGRDKKNNDALNSGSDMQCGDCQPLQQASDSGQEPSEGPSASPSQSTPSESTTLARMT